LSGSAFVRAVNLVIEMKLTFRHYAIACLLLYPTIFVVKYFNVEWAEKIFVPLYVLMVLAFNVYVNATRLRCLC
jgi:ABC-type transport system involved in cytochrome c biogenesis permease subunit